MSLLNIKDLHVEVGGKQVVSGLDLTIERGEVHAIMGPNGSGKSSLVNALMGHPHYAIMKGAVQFQGKDLMPLKPDERAALGLFLAFQYPKDIAGVSLRSFLFAAYKAQMKARDPERAKTTPVKFKKLLEEHLKKLSIDPAFAERFVNKGFSGGEKKKAEVLQMQILEPVLALLDETDSGLDVDALKIVAEGVNAVRSQDRSFLIVTHYARILDYIEPDHVHVMVKGRIVQSGGSDLARTLESQGYAEFANEK